MNDLRDLYQDVILDHSRNPRNAGKGANCSHTGRGNNPLCGDKISICLVMDGDTIEDVKFDARGCAISVASASMMTEIVKGNKVDRARDVFERFHEALTAKEAPEPDALEALDKLAALTGVREFPMRVKCATLPWHTLNAALADGGEEEISTE